MKTQILALLISHAVVHAITTLTLIKMAQPPTTTPVACPTHTQSPSAKPPEPAPGTETEDIPDALNFDLPE